MGIAPPAAVSAGPPLTVVQTLPEMHSGGVERGVVEVGRALVRAGHRSIVVSGGGRLVTQLKADGSEHVEMPIGKKSPMTLRLVKSLRGLLRSEGVDVLHARSRVPAWVSFLAWRSMSKSNRPRFVTTVHGLHSVSRFSSVMTRGETVIAVSDTVREYVEDNYPGCPPENIRVIPRGVDPDAFPYGHMPADRWVTEFFEKHPECRGKRLVTLPGRLTRLKGHHDFLKVLEASSEEVHGLIVGGKDPRRAAYAEELERAASAGPLAGRVTFTGHRSDLREVMSISDAVLSLSTKPESFGRTVLEALSLGRPVVGYDHGGVGEILGNCFPEGRVPRGDTEAAARVLDEVLHGFVLPAPVEGYRLSDMLDAVLGLYREVALASRGRAA